MDEDTFHLGVKALLRNSEGQILLLEISREYMSDEAAAITYWDLPGGRVKEGETVTETLRREVEEETGITKLENLKPLGMVLSKIRIPVANNKKVGLILSIYTCTSPHLADTITLSGEHSNYQWHSPQKTSELLGTKYSEEFCEIIARLEA